MKHFESMPMILALSALIVFCGWTCLNDPTVAQTDAANQSGASNQSDAVASMTCPKCKGTMEAGVVLDYFGNQFYQSQWAPGNPHWHILGRMPKTKNVVTYRCTNCGYLQSYAK